MATLGQIIARTRGRLSGSQATASAMLATALTDTGLAVVVDDASLFSRGVAEIDLEQVRVSRVDTAARTLHLPPYGRGYNGTEAKAHAAGAEVVFAHPWPSSLIADEVNGVITELYPQLYAVRTHESTIRTDNVRIDLPADATGVISVWLGSTTDSELWLQEDRWSFNPDASDNGYTLRVGGLHRPGTPVRVVYAAAPVPFDLTVTDPLTQDFATVTGLQDRVADILTLGVAARLSPFVEVARLGSVGAEARADTQAKPAGAGTSIGRYLAGEFRARVAQEQRVLAKEHPIRVHRAR